MQLRKLGNNRHELTIGNYLILFSYETPVGLLDTTTGILTASASQLSCTTKKHLNEWVRDTFHNETVFASNESIQAILNSLTVAGEEYLRS